MKSSAQRLRPVPAPEVAPEPDRALAPLYASLTALQARVEQLERRMTPSDTLDPDPPSTLSRLELACLDLGLVVSADRHVSERDAARLIGRSQSTLRAWRKYFGGPLSWRRFAGRSEYALEDLAAFLDEADKSR